MNNNEIMDVLKDFYQITGLRAALYDKNMQIIAAFPDTELSFCSQMQRALSHNLCLDCRKLAALSMEAQKKPVVLKSGCGLSIAASPLYNFGALSGFILIGPIIESENNKLILSELERLTENSDDLKKAVNSIPVLSKDNLEASSRVITLCARSFNSFNSIGAIRLTVGESAKKYISENYGKKIRISDLCRELSCSKSTLLSSFKREYGITLGDFITEYRLEQAKVLLENGNLNINEIANRTGFYDQAYFSKVFSSKCGKTPSEYRRVAKFRERSE